MAESPAATDMGTGVAMAFGALAVIAALATAATSTLYAIDGAHVMQTASGAAVASSMLFAALAVVALHRYGE
jgi:hypothetical protein